MIVVAVADIHGHVEHLDSAAELLGTAQVVVLAGDLTHFGGRREAAAVVEAVRRHNPRVLAVPGNCDRPEAARYLEQEGISLDGRGLLVDGVGFVGAGGSLPAPGGTPTEREEEELARLLARGATQLGGRPPQVAVIHQPPADSALDRVPSGAHVGSRAVRAFLEGLPAPAVCFTGHIHESRGRDAVGACAVVNPGPLAQGHLARARLGEGAPQVEVVAISGGPGQGGRR